MYTDPGFAVAVVISLEWEKQKCNKYFLILFIKLLIMLACFTIHLPLYDHLVQVLAL